MSCFRFKSCVGRPLWDLCAEFGDIAKIFEATVSCWGISSIGPPWPEETVNFIVNTQK